MPIFQYTFPDCQAHFAFDNALNHCCFAEDAFIASNISLNPGGTQPHMREGFDHARGLPHPLVFSNNHPNFSLQSKAKGAAAILRDRGLWPVNSWRSDGFNFKLECSKKPHKDQPAGTDASSVDHGSPTVRGTVRLSAP